VYQSNLKGGSIFAHSSSVIDIPLIVANIQAGAKEYQFGAFVPELAQGQKNWLVQEIQNWVGMK